MGFISIIAIFAFTKKSEKEPEYHSIDELRKVYSSGDITSWPKATVDSSVAHFKEIGKLPKVKFPENNPFSMEKAILGKKLFFDPKLSVSGQIACASCHEPQLGWGDGKRFSNGDVRKEGKRNAQTIMNIAYADKMFWDGRAADIEDQIHFPVEDPLEMNTPQEVAMERISKLPEYKEEFKKVFGTEEITFEKIALAIATFERTVISGRTKFDKFIEGNSKVYSDEEVLGLHIYRTKAQCMNCHNGPYFSDNDFHNIGLTYYGRKFEDLGRYNVTKETEDVGKFRTPSLREVTATGPWMHNGLFTNLDGIINLYNAGMPTPKRKAHQMNDTLFPKKSHLLKPLNLTKEERKALVAFLKTLESSMSKKYIK